MSLSPAVSPWTKVCYDFGSVPEHADTTTNVLFHMLSLFFLARPRIKSRSCGDKWTNKDQLSL